MKPINFLFILASFFSACTPAGRINSHAKKDLLSDTVIQQAHVGICLYDPAQSKFLFTHQSDRYFIPASNTKLFTMFAALKYLGDSLPGLQYAESDSVLWIRPTGDASFLCPYFPEQPVYDFLKRNRAEKIVVDWPARNPDRYGSGWMVADMTEDETLPRSVFPVYGHVPVYSDSQHNSLPLGQDNGQESTKFLSDTLRKSFRLTRAPDNLAWKTLYSRHTDSFIRNLMIRSDNHLAEHLLLMAAQSKLGFMREDVLIESLLATDLADLPQKPRWADGSGASRYNLFTPASMVFLLEKMRHDFGFDRLKKLLPTGGEGTLAKYYLSISGSIFAKTGTLSNNQALSGYLITRKGRLLEFSIMVNHYKGPARPVRQRVENFLLHIWEDN